MDYHTFQTTFCETFPSISTWKRTFRSSWTWAPEQKDHPSPTKLERQFHVAPAMQQPNTAVSTPLLWIFKTKNKAKRALKCKATVTHSDLHTTRAQWVCSEAENRAIQLPLALGSASGPSRDKVNKCPPPTPPPKIILIQAMFWEKK